jgi:2-polyprenyl-3-methyl-5-hydroxy-6-metoxy-1,4-benzoquinol methylase
MSYTPIRRCLACDNAQVELYLDLGIQPLANSYHDGSTELQSYPLGVAVCRQCWHTQLTVAVDPDLMFKNYLYVSGTTKTLGDYFSWFVERVEADIGARLPLRVLDIASNDGSLLEKFANRGHSVQGVDPAENLRTLSEAKGVPTYVGYWDEASLTQLGETYDVIVAMNVLAHIKYPAEFLALCRRALRPGGRIYIQTSQANMIKNGEFDTIYHEHHSFFSVQSFLALAARAGLQVIDIEHVPVHGTSYLVQLVPSEQPTVQEAATFAVGQAEHIFGYYNMETYENFARRAEVTRVKVKELVAWSRQAGYRIVGYGAAAKGMTFLNFAELDLDYLVDDNPLKVGLMTPGRNIKIVGPAILEQENSKTLFLVLAWNFYEEIMGRIKDRRAEPFDSFLTYFPRVALVAT